MRLAGTVPWEWMVDRLRRPRSWPMWDDLPEFVESVRLSYRRDVWVNQPEYVEVWCEKDALSGIFEEVLEPYGVTLNVGRGFDGWSSIKDASDRLGHSSTVLYFGDFDPSGEDISRSLQERLADPLLPEGGSRARFVRCALNHDDVTRYALPSDFTKAADPRRAAFVEKYGDVAVELDALPPDALRERIETEVSARMDPHALEQTRRLQREDQRRLEALLDQL